ncbi:hypothetical protein GGF37_000827 [Kickxella alabastrina]|nr:hypothetical protein GGF37_000827 [Kickxella alabastrina]
MCCTLYDYCDLEDYFAEYNGIKLSKNMPFCIYPFRGVVEDVVLVYCMLDDLEEVGISIENKYIINIDLDEDVCKILNTKNNKFATTLYLTQKYPPKPAVDDTLEVDNMWSDVIKGTYKGEIDYDKINGNQRSVVRFAMIRHPHMHEQMVGDKDSSLEEFIGLANLVFKGIVPAEPPTHSEIPLDFLPIPSKEIVQSLDDRWWYFSTAWSILGGYKLDGPSYCFSHLELAFRNGLYTPDMKADFFPDMNNDKPLRSKDLFEKPSLKTVFEFYYFPDCGTIKEESYDFWLESFGLDLSDFDRTTLIPGFEVMPDRPWHKLFLRREQNAEMSKWLEEDY